MGDLLGRFSYGNQHVSVSVSLKSGKPRGRLRCGRRARLEDLKMASREGGEAWNTSKESGDIYCSFDITFFLPDPHALGTTLLEGGGG